MKTRSCWGLKDRSFFHMRYFVLQERLIGFHYQNRLDGGDNRFHAGTVEAKQIE